jgi:hypothetical protein
MVIRDIKTLTKAYQELWNLRLRYKLVYSNVYKEKNKERYRVYYKISSDKWSNKQREELG